MLTAREQQVSTHVLRGATDREIAKALVVSTRTVHKHLERIYRKLDLTNRTSRMALLAAQTDGAAVVPPLVSVRSTRR
ncbi:MAG TPA: helix-turn-helix transcriptional regulator [Actinophytocola sp.]|uniref:response regulator transcription factor n=1 Tax=Actinophytocola sp. TaxID=1872138 RepID=UPI002DBBD203|nr:helix-turn-helix transcriptional regulator [Actinophytocola sp.]HEU5469191.1 helix-turn-helix transcriptional regulator [Actinophytocola sp.]